MGRGIQAEVWSCSCGLRDPKTDVEGFVRLVQKRYTNEGGGDLEVGFKGIKWGKDVLKGSAQGG